MCIDWKFVLIAYFPYKTNVISNFDVFCGYCFWSDNFDIDVVGDFEENDCANYNSSDTQDCLFDFPLFLERSN